MISNERPSSFGSGFHQHAGFQKTYQSGPPKPRVNEVTLKTETIQVERKMFILALKENPRGRFLRITEDVQGRRDNVIIPATGLEEFQKVLGEMVKVAEETKGQFEVIQI